MKYFKVIAKCGHVGRNNYILKAFYVECIDGEEAASIVKISPRVKHNHKDVIREVDEIAREDYFEGRKNMSRDPYFIVHNKQTQKLLCPDIMENVCIEEPKEKYTKRGIFKHIRELVLLKEDIKEMRGGYLYE